MTEEAIREIAHMLAETDEADDALRQVVARIADEPGVEWAGVAFLEGGAPMLGPSAGTPNETRRARVAITYRDDPVGELVVDGAADAELLARVADLIAPLVLIGWDTRGEAWEP